MHSHAIQQPLESPWNLFRAVLDTAEASFCVVDRAGRLVFINPSAQRLLGAGGALPEWARERLAPMLADVARHGAPRVETWSVDDTLLRVRLRALDDTRTVSLLEIDVVHAGSGRHIEQTLARSLDLNLTEARMLAYVWRGMTNDDIGQELRLKLGTVKSRLSRLYRRLGVRHRSAAVLRAAEVLA